MHDNTNLETSEPAQINDIENQETNIPVWTFEGKEYPCFVANSQDVFVSGIRRSKDDPTVIGHLECRYDWRDQKSEPFLERENYGWKKIRDIREGETVPQLNNIDKLNKTFFDAICVGGSLTPLADGEFLQKVELSPEQMRGRTTELKSNAVDLWLSSFHIRRYFKSGQSELDALTSGSVDAITFICYIGSLKEPTQAILLEFIPPSDDARRAYDDGKVKNSSTTDGTKETIVTSVDNARKIRYAKKYLSRVDGACVENEQGKLVPVKDDNTLQLFKSGFNPHWFMQLAESLQDSFDIGGK